MANEQNLIPYKKGQSGNPAGKPKGTRNRSTIARAWLDVEEKFKNPITGEIETLKQEDIITLSQIRKARNGDPSAYNAIMNSAYGAPHATSEVNVTSESRPIAEIFEEKLKELEELNEKD